MDAEVQAWLVGGYHGCWLPVPDAAGLTLDNRSLRKFGAAAGAGVLAALPSDRCALAETARVVSYLAAESAGQAAAPAATRTARCGSSAVPCGPSSPS